MSLTRRDFLGTAGSILLVGPVSARTEIFSVGFVDLDTENHYATIEQSGVSEIFSSSKDFDPHRLRTAASHIKLLTAIVAWERMKEAPELNTAANIELLNSALIASKNSATVQLAVAFAGSEDRYTQWMMEKARDLKLSPDFLAANTSGLPDAIPNERHDSFATANDINIIMRHIALHHAANIKNVLGQITANTRSTSRVVYPLSDLHPNPSPVWMYSKTATDKYQRGTTATLIVMDNKTYIFQHEHAVDDTRSPSATMARIILQVFAKKNVAENPTNADFFKHLRDVAENLTAQPNSLPSPHLPSVIPGQEKGGAVPMPQ